KHFEMKTKPPKDLGMIAFMLFWFCVINYMVYIRKDEWRENLKVCEEDGPIKKKLRAVSAAAFVTIIIFIFIFFALYKSPDLWHIALVKFLSVW
ncbi:MAG TPA: hypothetical protein VHP30_12465, partial [Ignavibacteriales bacterium]|nr:hypothetical protein [Ignavibacteriales bacterium]